MIVIANSVVINLKYAEYTSFTDWTSANGYSDPYTRHLLIKYHNEKGYVEVANVNVKGYLNQVNKGINK